MSQFTHTAIQPGKVWHDSHGSPIQAHGGSVLYAHGTYYWFGEDKRAETIEQRVEFTGFRCYASEDLLNWRDEGIVLSPVADDPEHDLYPQHVPERPRVIYNAGTGQYVLWAHIDRFGEDGRRCLAHTGVAVSASPTGPYAYLGSFRPNSCESRDMTVFVDDDGAAYLCYASARNADLHITRLRDDYLSPCSDYQVLFPGAFREAPALCKHHGLYYLITSGCTGWYPNRAEYAVSASPFGPWQIMGSPCIGSEEMVATTFNAQATCVLPVAGRPGAFLFLADRWNADCLSDSRYVWLPMRIEGERVSVEWHDSWDVSIFDQASVMNK